jgi:hypothetical protein
MAQVGGNESADVTGLEARTLVGIINARLCDAGSVRALSRGVRSYATPLFHEVVYLPQPAGASAAPEKRADTHRNLALRQKPK